ENATALVIDGNMGFGQVIGEETMSRLAPMAKKAGMALATIRNCGHAGRLGDWAEQLAQHGLISMHFLNTTGLGMMAMPCGGSARPGVTVMANTMTSLAIDPTPFTDRDAYIAEINRYLDWVKGSPPSQPGGEVLLPGEVEHRTRAERLAKGVPLDEASWRQIVDAAGTVGIDEAKTRRLAGHA